MKTLNATPTAHKEQHSNAPPQRQQPSADSVHSEQKPPTPRSSLIGGKPFLPVRGEIVPKDHRTPKYLHHQRPVCTLGLLRPQHLHQTPPTTPDSLRCWVCRLDLDSRVGRNHRHLRPTAGSVALTWPCTNKKNPHLHQQKGNTNTIIIIPLKRKNREGPQT